MEVRAGDVPEWIQKGELYRGMNPESDDDVLTFYQYVESYNVTNIEEFGKLIEFTKYAELDEYPYSIYVYGYYDQETVEEYLFEKLRDSHYDAVEKEKQKLSGDYEGFYSFVKSYLTNNYSANLHQKYLDTITEKYEKFKNPKRKYLNGNTEEKRVDELFRDIIPILLNTGEEYLILKDIENSQTFFAEIDSIYKYCVDNPTYYKSFEIIEGYEKSIKYRIKLSVNIVDEQAGKRSEIKIESNEELLKYKEMIREDQSDGLVEGVLEFYMNDVAFANIFILDESIHILEYLDDDFYSELQDSIHFKQQEEIHFLHENMILIFKINQYNIGNLKKSIELFIN